VIENGYYELQIYSVSGALLSAMTFFPGSGASTRFPIPPKVGEVKVEYHPPETEREPMAPGFLRFEENTIHDHDPLA
jgi:hypothetical protein